MQSLQKDVLFYSNYCDYSKEILGIITKKNIRNDFVLVCVDSRTHQLPPFVDRVPLVFSKDKQIIVDEAITEYVDSRGGDSSSSLEPFALFACAGKANYSDGFSYITEESDNDMMKGYMYLNTATAISTVAEDPDSGKKSKIDSSILEKYMAERDNDIKIIKNSIQNSI